MLNVIPYCIIIRYSAPLDNYLGCILDINLHICVPANIDLICGLALIFLCGYYQLAWTKVGRKEKEVEEEEE